MTVLTEQVKEDIYRVIDTNSDYLRSLANFVSAEPGFAIVDGEVVREPAILVFVSHKQPVSHLAPEERAPRELGGYRVAVMQANPYMQLESLSELHGLPGVAREAAAAATFTYEPLPTNPINAELEVPGPFTCHVGPDDGFRGVLGTFLAATKNTLSVAMYDFDAKYIEQALVENVLAEDVSVKLNWDTSIARVGEPELMERVAEKLGDHLDAEVVESGSGHRFETSYHEKVAVRDSKAIWLSSGNWTVKSQPDIDPIGDPDSAVGMYGDYNREWHVVIEDEPLAKLFERYIEYDLAGSKQEAEEQQGLGFPKAAALRQRPDLFVPIDALVDPALRADQVRDPVAPKVFPSTPRNVRVKPVLTPDNYLDRVQEMVASAQRSVYIQFAYIKYSNAPRDQRFKQLLDLLGEISRRPDFNMKIILNSREAADQARRLVEDDGANFRDLKVFRSQGNIHNKGIVVDREKVLISSTNWSSAGALRNRDAGLIVEDAEIASFYEEVFLSDWYCRARPINEDPVAVVAIPGAPTPPGMARVSWQEYYGD